jgi:hypothetical protein
MAEKELPYAAIGPPPCFAPILASVLHPDARQTRREAAPEGAASMLSR